MLREQLAVHTLMATILTSKLTTSPLGTNKVLYLIVTKSRWSLIRTSCSNLARSVIGRKFFCLTNSWTRRSHISVTRVATGLHCRMLIGCLL